ncbi:MAG: NrfD/PsrC family molybdoenzyme membrane anchor subunit [Opitutaceae bacterium]|nr:NrfD/PsrC family molybdoenzyme membrane anchor subunit [Opitutaceae bacterium]
MEADLNVLQWSAEVQAALPHVEGYAYPNETHVLWSVLIVIYPYITGLVAGAFIMASLVRVFNVRALAPVYRLALLTALAFLICAPLPLLLHIGHPERCLQVMMTPHLSSPMAMFGFVYAWYMMAVLLLELWLDYRHDFVVWGRTEPGLKGAFYRMLTLGANDISPKALDLDERMSVAVTIIGIPSAFLLHGYVGFIFGSIKANPWWGNVLMPVIFIFSAIVSGIALCVFIYTELSWFRRKDTCDACLDAMGKFLFFALLVDFSVEALDWLHRLYSADESIHVLKQLAAGKLFYTMLIGQLCLGTLIPLGLLGATQLFGAQIPNFVRRRIYYFSALLIMAGVLLMRWNVVIGGQLFSKSLRGFTTFKLELAGQEGWLVGLGLLVLPFLILTLLVRLFLPNEKDQPANTPTIAQLPQLAREGNGADDPAHERPSVAL